MAIDYQKIYKKALTNKDKGISIKDTIEKELGHRYTGNFYKTLTKDQKRSSEENT